KLEQLQAKHTLIGNVRGLGMFIGIELVKDHETLEPATNEALALAELMKREGVLIGATGRFGNVIKVRPPLVFSNDTADLLVEKLDKLLTEISQKSPIEQTKKDR
ncbi:MAG: aminotransferase class III-fold pyridoxal phosphate-dependent enzyme, partial [Porticoccaceae bacterium]|nr:aminotransferase class III-fold pyridoxal phosphate-dependent enzyme [Porticoccaceae bacterium]